MTTRDDDLRVRPGRIQHGNRGGKRPQTFVGEVMRAAKKAGHVGNSFRLQPGPQPLAVRPRAARGGLDPAALKRPARGDEGAGRASPGHALPLGAAAQAYRLSEARGRHPRRRRRAHVRRRFRQADERAFAERCEDDRHHFRFIISPEDGGRARGPQDLYARADGRRREGPRHASSTGSRSIIGTPTTPTSMSSFAAAPMTARTWSSAANTSAGDFATAPPSASPWSLVRAASSEIRTALEQEVEAERWTSLDRALRDISDECGGVADLRPGPNAEDPELRRPLAWPGGQARTPRVWPSRSGLPAGR